LDRLDVDPDTFEPLDPQPQPLGWGEPVCDLYRTLTSVRDQVAITSVSCSAPGNTDGFSFQDHGLDLVFDDPCTFDVDESLSPWPGPDAAPTSYCGPVTAASLADAQSDPSTLFGGWTVGEAGEIIPPTAVED
jgi:hypothetical protein